MKKRSNNTLDSDTKKVISAEPEINTPASEIKKNIKQDAATRNVSNTSNNSVKQKEVLKEEDEVLTPNLVQEVVVSKAVNKLDDDLIKISQAKHHDPFSVLGRHINNDQVQIKVYLPYAETVCFSSNGVELNRITGSDFFHILQNLKTYLITIN